MLTAILLAVGSPVVLPPPPVATQATRQSPRVIRTPEMVADLYLPKRSGRAPAILLLGGSEGGLSKYAAQQAQRLADHGYVVLHLSYFGSSGQPTALKLIPIETFTRALDWMEAQPEIAADRIGIIGVSKGAEAALLVAVRRPDVKVTILGVPSSVVWPGIDGMTMVTESSWTERGRPLPFVPYGWRGEWKGILALYADGLADTAKAAAGAIPAERASGPIVMICGEADRLWPSCPMARAIEARLATAGFAHRVTMLAYADAGHAAFGPPPDPSSTGAAAIGALGGSVAGNLAARADGWPKVLAALDDTLMAGATR